MSTDACGDAARGPEFVHAVFEVVTPMFLGGAVPGETAELRPASIKGALRFWWRALAWGRHWNRLLQAIWEQEACLFGTAAATGERAKGKEAQGDAGKSDQKKNRAGRGQASFLLRAGWETRPRIVPKNERLKVGKGKNSPLVGPGARYLGYGLMEAFDNRKKNRSAGQLTRPCIREGAQFWVTLQACKRRNNTSATIDPMIIEALKLFGLIGGLGARTRRGWGSVRLLSLRCGKGLEAEADGGAPDGCGCPLCRWKPPANEKEFLRCVQDILTASEATANGTRSGLPPGAPPYSAFAQGTRVVVVLPEGEDAPKNNGNALAVLDYVGKRMLRFRGWGRTIKNDPEHQSSLWSHEVKSEQNFKSDHDGFRRNHGRWHIEEGSFSSGCPPQELDHPLRLVFGLPHNYSKKLKIEGEKHDRRASPLLIHIHCFDDGCRPVLTLFKSDFLPKISVGRDGSENENDIRDERIKIVRNGMCCFVQENAEYCVIDSFIDGSYPKYSSKKRKYFPNKQELWPVKTGGA